MSGRPILDNISFMKNIVGRVHARLKNEDNNGNNKDSDVSKYL